MQHRAARCSQLHLHFNYGKKLTLSFFCENSNDIAMCCCQLQCLKLYNGHGFQFQFLSDLYIWCDVVGNVFLVTTYDLVQYY